MRDRAGVFSAFHAIGVEKVITKSQVLAKEDNSVPDAAHAVYP